MKFFTKLSFFLLFWSVIFGGIMGILGINLSLITIADFYLQQGTQQIKDNYSFRIDPKNEQKLTDDSIIEIRNIEGVAFVDPYFTPTTEIVGSINYFGFQASYPIQVKGIPRRIGQADVKARYLNTWDSADIAEIGVLLPQQAITLYNNIAPQRGWPNLEENSFLGLPGISMNIETNSIRAVISGFDAKEFGTIISAPAQKLFSIYENLGYDPSYNYFIVETVTGLTPQQLRDTQNKIESSGYSVANASAENFQRGLFTRIKYTLAIIGGSILLAFIALVFYSIGNLYRSIQRWTWHHRIWGIKDSIGTRSIFLSLIFSFVSGIISWIITFFAVVPAQRYMIDTLDRFGFNTPDLRETAYISLLSGFFTSGTFLIINLIIIVFFYKTTPRASYIKKY